MTDEKMLELARVAGFTWARATDREDAQARVWADIRDDGECIDELRKFAALVRREALEEAKLICKQREAKFDDIGRPDCAVGAHVCACQIEVLAAQEADK